MYVTLIFTTFWGRYTNLHHIKGKKTKVRRIKILAQGYAVEEPYSNPVLPNSKTEALSTELVALFVYKGEETILSCPFLDGN